MLGGEECSTQEKGKGEERVLDLDKVAVRGESFAHVFLWFQAARLYKEAL